MKNTSGKKTIGLLVGGIIDSFSIDLSKDVMNAASSYDDINLVVIPGKYINRDYSKIKECQYEYQYNTLFCYPKPNNIDGLIIAVGSIGCFTNEAGILAFLEQFKGIPTVLVAGNYEGYISINYDNETGIRQAMEYLIKQLGYTKICMIGGPEDNYDAKMRKEIYLKILKENEIAFEDRFFVKGDLSQSSEDVFNTLLDNNPDAQAIFCINDIVALGLYDAMKKRGIMPGRDIKVFGYGNDVMAIQAIPPISSVGLGSTNLGTKALSVLYDEMNNEPITSSVVPTKFIARDSFDTYINTEKGVDITKIKSGHINKVFDDIFYRYKDDSFNRENINLKRCFYEIVSRTIKFVTGQYVDELEYNEVLRLINIFFDHSALDYTDADTLLLWIHKFHDMLIPSINQNNIMNQIDKLFECIRDNIIHVTTKNNAEALQNFNQEKIFIQAFTSKNLNFRHGCEQDFVSLFRNITLLKIQSAYMYLFEEPIIHMINEPYTPPEYIYLKAICKDAKVFGVPLTRQKRSISELFSGADISKPNYQMVLLPIHYQENLYGLILCDLNDMIFENGEFIASLLSFSIHSLYLIKRTDELILDMEKTLAKEKSGVTIKELPECYDNLTGVYTEDKFHEIADKMISSQQYDNLITGYVTINHLNIINYKFSHDEGDCAIKNVANLLKDFLGDKGIVGRIGGDEFIILYPYDMSEDELRADILKQFDAFNKESDSKYNLLVAIGLKRVDYKIGRTITEALAVASEKLYIDKSNKDIYLLKD